MKLAHAWLIIQCYMQPHFFAAEFFIFKILNYKS